MALWLVFCWGLGCTTWWLWEVLGGVVGVFFLEGVGCLVGVLGFRSRTVGNWFCFLEIFALLLNFLLWYLLLDFYLLKIIFIDILKRYFFWWLIGWIFGAIWFIEFFSFYNGFFIGLFFGLIERGLCNIIVIDWLLFFFNPLIGIFCFFSRWDLNQLVNVFILIGIVVIRVGIILWVFLFVW